MDRVDQLVWWNFVDQESDLFFPKWHREEVEYLVHRKVKVELPLEQNRRLNWERKWPVSQVAQQLVFCWPERLKGGDTVPHPLVGNLKASFENPEAVIWKTEEIQLDSFPFPELKPPNQFFLPLKEWEKPKALLRLPSEMTFVPPEQASPSSLESLLYYPHKWFFKYYLGINKSPILSIVEENKLLGNLAHRFIESVLEEESDLINQEIIHQKIDAVEKALLPSEGAVLLMYGREPERINFLNTIKFSAWKLVNLLKENNWSVYGKEYAMEGLGIGLNLKGRADLVLIRGAEKAVVDLKWRGATFRKNMIKNEEDIQLLLYAQLLKDSDIWPHTAFFIIQNAQMLARDNRAFKQIESLNQKETNDEVYQRLYEVIQRTYHWRINQLKNGQLEIRTEFTSKELEVIYGEELLDVLEMKQEGAAFDEYKVLTHAKI